MTSNRRKSKGIKPQRTSRFNVENPPNTRGKNHGRQPARTSLCRELGYNANDGGLQDDESMSERGHGPMGLLRPPLRSGPKPPATGLRSAPSKVDFFSWHYQFGSSFNRKYSCHVAKERGCAIIIPTMKMVDVLINVSPNKIKYFLDDTINVSRPQTLKMQEFMDVI